MIRKSVQVAAVGCWLSLSACKPSSEELARQAQKADAAEKARARKAIAAREAAEKREADELPRDPKPNSFACPMTAERAIKKMASCGLNTDGITAAGLCSKLGQVKLNFVASRTCPEIEAIMFSK